MPVILKHWGHNVGLSCLESLFDGIFNPTSLEAENALKFVFKPILPQDNH